MVVRLWVPCTHVQVARHVNSAASGASLSAVAGAEQCLGVDAVVDGGVGDGHVDVLSWWGLGGWVAVGVPSARRRRARRRTRRARGSRRRRRSSAIEPRYSRRGPCAGVVVEAGVRRAPPVRRGTPRRAPRRRPRSGARRRAASPRRRRSRLLRAGRERTGSAEGEEHRADVGGDAGVDDREELGPAAVAPLAPHRHDDAAAGTQRAMHRGDGARRDGHVHQPQRAQRDVERVSDGEVFGTAARDVDVRAPAALPHRSRARRPSSATGRWRAPGRSGSTAVAAGDADHAGAAGDVERRRSPGCRSALASRRSIAGWSWSPPISLVAGRGSVPPPPLDPPLQLRFHVTSPVGRIVVDRATSMVRRKASSSGLSRSPSSRIALEASCWGVGLSTSTW